MPTHDAITALSAIMDMKLELVPVPVADIDRAAAFYEQLGFVRDVDVAPSDGVRVVQLTPPASACSILLSTGLNDIADMVPGTIRGLHLVVNDIALARQELIGLADWRRLLRRLVLTGRPGSAR